MRRRKRFRFRRHYCIECGRPIIPYRPGYVRCKQCFSKIESNRINTYKSPPQIASNYWYKNKIFNWVKILIIIGILIFAYQAGWISQIATQARDFTESVQKTTMPEITQILPTQEITGQANPGFPYWPSKTITYSFDPNNLCDSKETANIKSAFEILHSETNGLLSYVETSNGKLVISCHNVVGSASWGGPWLYPDKHIDRATIDFYQLPPGEVKCTTYPTLELHEILHTLGFEDDFSSSEGIMYYGPAGTYWNPCRKIDEDIVECLKDIYSNGEQGSSCSGIPHK